ncbi:isovaleryl-CoA dehydrogenase [Aliidiomarina indica]|uniref:isovaleryl-CoA dehydrogenase n=1 Tax=Aliidiomarina indica TaxID=2749147 RepID=UPI00188EEBEB|nr:isovaleryl-CoA dehydrogenase [Aliidiomarina indica]
MNNQFYAETHEVKNVPPLLENYNSFTSDLALQEALKREGADWATADVERFGQLCGSAEHLALGAQANANKPTLSTHDRFGHRVDLIDYHPAYHRLMQTSCEHGLHSSPWCDPKPGAHVARAAKYYLHTQVEAGHGCPVTMTFAAIPALRHQPNLLHDYGDKIMASGYDPRNIPAHEKSALTIGMAMTEKQGGSDVRQNTTRAFPIGQGGPGQAYELLGHKWFVSAPMSDAFLVLAQTEHGLSCFFVPRWRPDGSKNPMQIQQLKNKMGNVSNASSEVELRGAHGYMVGEEGRGVRTIIEMVAATRYDCLIGSSAGMRQATVQAIHHCDHRAAFGATLTQQPLMQNLLADLALESEAAMVFMMRMARAMDHHDDEQERLLARIATPIGKYWICKRAPQHAYEAMEIIGGTGVMETHIMARLYREAPINAIWEGSGNVQCLDILRAIDKEPAVLEAYFSEVAHAKGQNTHLDRLVGELKAAFADADALPYRARQLADRMALALQASLLIQHAPNAVADAFCESRLSRQVWNYGGMPRGVACVDVINRGRAE